MPREASCKGLEKAFLAALSDWAQYQRDRCGRLMRLSDIRKLRKEFISEPDIFIRAVEHSIERGFFRLTLEPRDYEIRALRLKLAVLEAANALRGRAA